MRRELVAFGAVLWALPLPARAGDAAEDAARAAVRPSARQIAWQDLELLAFAHFGINTFTDREWGDGKEDPALFNPGELDARQWVQVLKRAGFKLLILTAKHHDGFCLWPSRETEHSVKRSPWRDGRGDVVREVAEASREGGLRFGIYLSPWDRHEPTYGDSPAYNRFFLAQLRELLSGYGPIAEVWFDGACGEGPNGKRQEYDWEAYYRLVRELQPEALIAITGPDIRWVGNESGVARETEWSVQPADPRLHPGKKLVWYPAECDVSIRPGWFYHPSQDGEVKTVEDLLEIYLKSVGRNAVLLLNVPPDRRGLIHEVDARHLAEFGGRLRRLFGRSVLEGRGAGTTVEAVSPRPVTFDHVVLMEDLVQGERVREYVVEALVEGQWTELCRGTSISHKRIHRLEPLQAQGVRLRVLHSAGEPQIRRLSAHWSLSPPVDPTGRPEIVKLGTVACDVVEATPVVFQGRLWRFEWVREGTFADRPGEPHFRFVDPETGEATAPFARGHLFGSAFVEGGTVYVTGTSNEERWTGRRVQVFASEDLERWESWTALNLPGFGICNTSVTRAGAEGPDAGRYVMMFEIHKPPQEAGKAFTARFATSRDFKSWELTPPECVYAQDRYTAPHCLRYLDGFFYNFYLEAHEGYEMRVVRSRDLVHWEPSPLDPVLRASEDDRIPASTRLTSAERRRIARATNSNNSDIDFCQYRGRLVISYSWGNQQGVEHLAEALYLGTEKEFLRGWFPP